VISTAHDVCLVTPDEPIGTLGADGKFTGSPLNEAALVNNVLVAAGQTVHIPSIVCKGGKVSNTLKKFCEFSLKVKSVSGCVGDKYIVVIGHGLSGGSSVSGGSYPAEIFQVGGLLEAAITETGLTDVYLWLLICNHKAYPTVTGVTIREPAFMQNTVGKTLHVRFDDTGATDQIGYSYVSDKLSDAVHADQVFAEILNGAFIQVGSSEPKPIQNNKNKIKAKLSKLKSQSK